MDFVVVGAGAVGAVLGSLLEADGHRVQYWARRGQARDDRPFALQRDRGAQLRSKPLQWIGDESLRVPSDWVLVCVRTEQLSAALAQVAQNLGAERAVAIATVTLDGALATARAAGLRGPVLALHASFGSGFSPHDERELTWFPFTPPTTVSAEGQSALRDAASDLARALARAGLPTRSVLDMGGMMRFMVMSNIALLPAWEACEWDIARFARNRELRALTASAMHETARHFAPESGPARMLARATPAFVYAAVLRVLPWLMGSRAARLWTIHGPKVRDQTRWFLHALLERAERERAQLPHLRRLAQASCALR